MGSQRECSGVAHTRLRLYCSPSIFAVIKLALISLSRESAVHPQKKQLRVMGGEIEDVLAETPVTGQGKKQPAAQNWHWLSTMEQTHRRPPCPPEEQCRDDGEVYPLAVSSRVLCLWDNSCFDFFFFHLDIKRNPSPSPPPFFEAAAFLSAWASASQKYC